MKLFSAIATAAVIGGSFLITVPAEARGWRQMGETTNGDFFYVKDVQCAGPICEFDFQLEAKNFGKIKQQLNCNNWTLRVYLDGSWGKWYSMSPSSMQSVVGEKICR